MTITLRLSPQIEQVLATRAREQGVTIDACVQSVVEDSTVGSQTVAMSPEDLDAAFDELSAGSDRLPVLSPEAYTREGIYKDG
jgi:hypothetical protein